MEKSSDKEFKSFTLTRRKGIDDLTSEYAFRGASQGDESVSNSIEDYKNSGGWLIPVFHGIDITNQEAIDKEVIRRKKQNENYINELKANGEYGKEFEYTIHIKPNPIFDDAFNTDPHGRPLKSCKMLFIDTVTGNLIELKKES